MAEKPSSKGKQEEITETESPSPAPQPEQPEKAPEKSPAYVPPATREKRQRSVVHYIAILFAAAFLLMLMAYLMDQRQNQAMNDLNQSLTGLQDSLTDQSSLQDIYEDNMQLIQQEAAGETVPLRMILTHAEDLMMSADTIHVLSEELISLL